MGLRLRPMMRSGSMLMLAGLVLGSGCGPTKTRGRPFAIPVPEEEYLNESAENSV